VQHHKAYIKTLNIFTQWLASTSNNGGDGYYSLANDTGLFLRII